MNSVMEREDAPNTSLNTSLSFRFDIGETVLRKVFLSDQHADKLEAVTYQIPKMSDISRWGKRGLLHSEHEQITDLSGILTVVFISF